MNRPDGGSRLLFGDPHDGDNKRPWLANVDPELEQLTRNLLLFSNEGEDDQRSCTRFFLL